MKQMMMTGALLLAVPVALHGQQLLTTTELAAQARSGLPSGFDYTGGGYGREGSMGYVVPVRGYAGAVGAGYGVRYGYSGNLRTGDMGTTNTTNAYHGSEAGAGMGADVQGAGRVSSGGVSRNSFYGGGEGVGNTGGWSGRGSSVSSGASGAAGGSSGAAGGGSSGGN